ncbi:hypothetical protein QE152_g11326 [Popillia japonica]|uniref:Uncharacterized protein n=1 Tax=Popillia japonica TaxID=7064 RepID=A0AAW1LS82_POPJA
MWWKILVVTTIQLNLNMALYYLVFTKKESPLSFAIPYYMCETIYFVDVVLVIMYRCLGQYSRTQFYSPRHALLITIDVISLLPIYELYYIIEHCSNGSEMDGSRDLMKLKTVLRLQYVVSFYKSIRNHPGLLQEHQEPSGRESDRGGYMRAVLRVNLLRGGGSMFLVRLQRRPQLHLEGESGRYPNE